jgi:hypothetical protein
MFNELNAVETPVSKEVLAEEKLERLLTDDFKDYGIRFANLSELETILQTGEFQGAWAFVPEANGDKDFKTLPFNKYVELGKGGEWSNIAGKQADWYQGVDGLNAGNFLLQFLKQARNEKKEEDTDKEERRQEILERMRDLIIEKVSKEKPFEDEIYYVNEFLYLAINYDQLTKEVENTLKSIVEIIGNVDKIEKTKDEFGFINYQKIKKLCDSDKEKADQCYDLLNFYEFFKKRFELFDEKDIAIAAQWFKNPIDVDLRTFMTLVEKNRMNEDAGLTEQYNIALVVDRSNVNIDNPDEEGKDLKGWGNIKKGDPQKALLGVICASRNKNVLNEVMKISKKGSIAYPVFDCNGKVKYPENHK